jgi:putative nucleotidyltransferase with HDIG domain
LSSAGHLVRRFFTSLAPGGPGPADAAWVRSLLSPSEQGLWERMSGPDQRHAAAVARRVDGAGVHDRPALVAALLHDVGKVESGLSTLERVPATLSRPWRSASPVPDRWRRYYDHPSIGARLLDQAGSDPLVVTWAAEHHLPSDRWTVPPALGQVLKAADDD